MNTISTNSSKIHNLIIIESIDIAFVLVRKRHHEGNPYALTDSSAGGVTSHSVPKRMATRNSSQSNPTKSFFFAGTYSPPSSTGSDSSSSTATNSTSASNSIGCQLGTCSNDDCVIHDHRHSTNIPIESISNSNSIYANNNLLLYYAHLERCPRYGQNIHQDTSSS